MKKTILIMMLIATAFSFSQEDEQLNIAQTQLLNLADLQSGLTIGGYGEVTYNDFDTGPSEIDVQRLIILFAYKFDDRVSFITEILGILTVNILINFKKEILIREKKIISKGSKFIFPLPKIDIK